MQSRTREQQKCLPPINLTFKVIFNSAIDQTQIVPELTDNNNTIWTSSPIDDLCLISISSNETIKTHTPL